MTEPPSHITVRRPFSSWRPSRIAMGRSMIAIGVMGVIAAVVGLIVGQIVLGQVEDSVDDSLALTTEALVAVDDSITVTSSVVETVRAGTANLQSTLSIVETSLRDTSIAIDDSSVFLGGALPDALDAVGGVLPTIESVASSIDDALQLLEQAPFGPDYDPVKPFDDSIAELSDALSPLSGELRTLSDDFDGLSGSTADIADDLDQLGLDVGELEQQLDDVSLLLDRYTSTTTEARALAAESRADLSQSTRVTRWLLVLLAAVFGAGQLVPIWLGAALLRDRPISPDADRAGPR